MPTAHEQTLLDAVMRRAQNGGRCKSVFFWNHAEAPGGAITAACLSQWYPAPFVLAGQRYLHAEQYMMAAKAALFGDEATRCAILQTAHPGAAKTLGRKVQGFDEARWKAARFDTVLRANHAKFEQNAALGAFLRASGERLLVEASPLDCIWGIGLAADDERAHDPLRWRGLNLLGLALMQVRAALRG